LRKHAQEIGAELWCIGSEFGFSLPSPGEKRAGEGGVPLDRASPTLTPPRREREQIQGQWDYRSKTGARNALPVPALRGAFQLSNASAALAALDALKDKLPVNMQAVRRGLAEVQLAGRFQFVPGQPQLILDVAHNPHAARSLAQNLAGLPPAQTFAVFAMLRDKDIDGVVRAMDAQIDVWLVAGIDVPRGACVEELAQVLQTARVRGEVKICGSIADALHEADIRAGGNGGCDSANGSLPGSRLRGQPSGASSPTRSLRAPRRECRIAAFGSFYTVAEVMRARGMRVSRNS